MAGQLKVKIRYWVQITEEYGEWALSPEMDITTAKILLDIERTGGTVYERGEIVFNDLFDF